jgi:hypothetical protein
MCGAAIGPATLSIWRAKAARVQKVDVDNSGYVEAMEVEVAIYRLYNIINKRLPGWQDPPKRTEILVRPLTT